MRTMTAWLTLAALGAWMFAGLPPVAAQSSGSSSSGQQTRSGQQARSSQQRQSQQEASRRASRESQSRSSRGQSSQRSNGMPEERREAVKHYYAGYNAGYRAGYLDSQDDYVLYIIDLQKKRGGRGASERSMASSDSERQMRGRLRQQMRSGMSGRGSLSASQNVQGEVLRTKRVPLKITGREHTVVLLETDQGKRRIVDLGPSRQLSDLSIEKGKRIYVEGRFARTRDDVPVLLAQRLQTGDESLRIERQMRQGERGQTGGRSTNRQSQRR